MNNGPWGTGIIPGYTSWSSRTGQVQFDPSSTNNAVGGNEQIYSNGQWQNNKPQTPEAPAFDWSSLFGNGQQSSAGPAVNTQITARPVYTQPQVNNALGMYGRFAPKGGGTAGNLYNQESQRARVNTDRSMAASNASMMLDSSKARSDAGLRLGSLGQQGQNMADQQGLQQQQYALSLLRALSGY